MNRVLLRRLPFGFLLVAVGVLVSVWLLRSALLPFFVALVVAYLLIPPVRFLARWMSRGTAVLLVMAGFSSALAGLAWLIIPWGVGQLERLLFTLPVWRGALAARWQPWLDAHPWVLAKLQQGTEGVSLLHFLEGLKGAGGGVLSWFLQAMTLLLVPLIVFYLLVDGSELLKQLDSLIPPRFRERVHGMVGLIHERLGGYIRGQIAVALAMALLQGLAFHAWGLPYAWLLGLVAGISNVVPYSPYITALPFALALAGLGGAGWGRILMTAVAFTAVQKAETLYFTPVWVGRASHLHPLEVLLALLCFGFAFGFLGLVFAVPLMIVVKVVFRAIMEDYKAHPWFRGEGA